MKFPNLSRRSFVASLFTLFLANSCKKLPSTAPASNSVTPPLEQPPVADASILAQYTVTELGNTANLFPLPDFFKQINYGYCDKTSYNPGDEVQFYLTGPKNNNHKIDLVDINGVSVFSFSSAISPQQIKSAKPWVDGCMFDKTTSVRIPNSIKSGFYTWKLGSKSVHENIPVVIKSADNFPEVTVVYASNTDNAYNLGGGKSLYGPSVEDRCTVASFLRFPFSPVDYTSSFFKWMSLQSYNANFVADVDLDDYATIQNSKIVILTGHSEYWTKQARLNIDKFVDSGKNLLVLSGNTMWWQVRYNLEKNLMICTKDHVSDPLSNTIYNTQQWPTPALKYPTTSSVGVDWNGGGYGNQLANRWNGFKIVQQNSPLFEGTELKNGDILKLPSNEIDGAPVVKMIMPGSDEIPVIDNSKLNFYKVELLAFDFAVNGTKPNGLGTFIVFKKKAKSGTVVNAATTDWCSPKGIGGSDHEKIAIITKNMIDKSLAGKSLLTS